MRNNTSVLTVNGILLSTTHDITGFSIKYLSESCLVVSIFEKALPGLRHTHNISHERTFPSIHQFLFANILSRTWIRRIQPWRRQKKGIYEIACHSLCDRPLFSRTIYETSSSTFSQINCICIISRMRRVDWSVKSSRFHIDSSYLPFLWSPPLELLSATCSNRVIMMIISTLSIAAQLWYLI